MLVDDKDIQEQHKPLELSYKDFLKMEKSLADTKIGKYYVIQEIGSGAFAEIYRGLNDQTKNQVAVKVLNLRNIEIEKNTKIKRIKKRLVYSQSRIMMSFNSPNILKCYQCYQNRDLKIMIIQYCNGGSLQNKIDKAKNIPEQEAILILRQIINGIGQCHRKKIIHRDLKADNILIHNGQYKIADFGFSKTLEISNQNQISLNTILGTITTMAPQVMRRQAYGLKADIWSIGVIFFQMIFGQCPFMSNSTDQILKQMSQNLFNMEEYRGICPSPRVKKFFQDILVVDVDKRLGWKQLTEHQIFKNKTQKLPSDFNFIVQLDKPDAQLLQLEKNLIIERNQSNHSILTQSNQKSFHYSTPNQKEPLGYSQQNDRYQSEINQANYKKHPTSPDGNVQSKKQQQPPKPVTNSSSVRKVNPSQMKTHSQNINREDQMLFKWAKKIHVECLKTEAIFNNIVRVIQKYQLFNLKQRQTIEMLYLILTRCLNNISPINDEYHKKQQSRTLQYLKSMIQKLYEQVMAKWLEYSEKLTKKQNEKLQMVFDFGSKLWHNSEKKKKDRFLGGIQTVDYNTKQQVDYTLQYIKRNKQNIKQSDSAAEIRNYLDKYQDICKISQDSLKGKQFKEYLNLVLM